MRILRRKLSKEEAILVCERMKLVASVKPRMAEILDLECDPKDDPLAQRLFGELLRGNHVLVDDSQRKVIAWDPENFPPLELIPLDLNLELLSLEVNLELFLLLLLLLLLLEARAGPGQMCERLAASQ